MSDMYFLLKGAAASEISFLVRLYKTFGRRGMGGLRSNSYGVWAWLLSQKKYAQTLKKK